MLENKNEKKLTGETTVKPKRLNNELGELVFVTVHHQDPTNKGTNIDVGINAYSATIIPGIRTAVPFKVAKFIKECTRTEHYFDEDMIAEHSKKKGVHTSRQVPLYVVVKEDYNPKLDTQLQARNKRQRKD